MSARTCLCLASIVGQLRLPVKMELSGAGLRRPGGHEPAAPRSFHLHRTASGAVQAIRWQGWGSSTNVERINE
jgi:hypothetical protein